jgi:hypothetical protein
MVLVAGGVAKSRMPVMEMTAAGGGFDLWWYGEVGSGWGLRPDLTLGSWARARARLAPASEPARAVRMRSMGRESSLRAA